MSIAACKDAAVKPWRRAIFCRISAPMAACPCTASRSSGSSQFTGVDGPDDVRMLQLGDEANLIEKAAQQRVVRFVFAIDRHRFDRDAAAQKMVLREKDDPHAAGA